MLGIRHCQGFIVVNDVEEDQRRGQLSVPVVVGRHGGRGNQPEGS